ncbi:Suppressor of cytokine signaling 7 [Taenia solium]|eukprot:TsM_000685800 transcript=TsM_000685800 gene=TsM_000685800
MPALQDPCFIITDTTAAAAIMAWARRFSFWFEPESHSASTVVEFIEKAVAHSIGGKYHYFLQTSTPGQQPVEVSLLYPLSRFQVVQSLKHLARFTILSNVRRDHVARLPLPPGQIGYLLEKQVYWESLEDFEETIRDRPPLQFTPVSASSSSSTAKP